MDVTLIIKGKDGKRLDLMIYGMRGLIIRRRAGAGMDPATLIIYEWCGAVKISAKSKYLSAII